MTSRIGMRLLAGVSLAAVIIGGIVIAMSPMQTASFGWFAYAPLSSTTFTPQGPIVLSTSAAVGVSIVILGLLALAFWAGLRVGRGKMRA